jgi:hypothetical protein
MVFIVHVGSLAAQDSARIWLPRTTGEFQTHYTDTVDGYIVMANSQGNETHPAVIAGKQYYAPLNIWDPRTEKIVSRSNNWPGGPMMPALVFKASDSMWFITDHYRIYRADVDWGNKTIKYEKVFEDSKDSVRIEFCVFSKESVYFMSNWAGDYLYMCNKIGQIRKKIRLNSNWKASIHNILSFTELDSKLWLGYSFVGGLSDGSGIGTIDTTTGYINMVTGHDYNYNLDGCEIRVINGIPFMVSWTCGWYQFAPVLFYYESGIWKIIGKQDFPEIIDGKMYFGAIQNYIFYPTGDTIKSNQTGWRELIKTQTGFVLGEKIAPLNVDLKNYTDKRWDIDFVEEEFALPFRIKYGYSPRVDVMYTIAGHTYGITRDVIGELVPISSTSVKRVETARFSIYPNPASNTIQISGLRTSVDYTVYTLQGKRLLSGNTDGSIDIKPLPPGMFILRTQGTYARFVKE